VVPDSSESLPGRGAWVHPTPACVEKSIARKAFGRALRVSVALDTSVLLTVLVTSGEERIAPLNEMAD
jgi:predicted RNA-binding protein YlxR (DUF448 family)